MKSVIAVNLKNLLKLRNLTQKELSEKLGVKLPVLNRWINGKSLPTTKSLDKLSLFFDVPVSYFYTGSFSEINSRSYEKDIEFLKLMNENLELKNKILELEKEILKLKNNK